MNKKIIAVVLIAIVVMLSCCFVVLFSSIASTECEPEVVEKIVEKEVKVNIQSSQCKRAINNVSILAEIADLRQEKLDIAEDVISNWDYYAYYPLAVDQKISELEALNGKIEYLFTQLEAK